jgi:hypothetical protein
LSHENFRYGKALTDYNICADMEPNEQDSRHIFCAVPVSDVEQATHKMRQW